MINYNVHHISIIMVRQFTEKFPKKCYALIGIVWQGDVTVQ